jgi:hypothetical protein
MDAMIKFFQTGGLFMYPILIVFAIGLAIAIERYIRLTMVRNANRSMWDKLHPVLSEGDFDAAREMTAENNSTISHLLNAGLELQGAVRRRDDIEIATGKAHTLHRVIFKHLHIAGTAWNDHGFDRSVYRGSQCKPGGKGRLVISQYFRSDEHNGFRFDGRYSITDYLRGADF